MNPRKEVTQVNKKEISEIKKQFSPANCAITRICGCYVDHEKNKKFESKSAFLSLPEEEAFKYYDIFKKTFSGGLGRNLLNMEFPLEQENYGGTQEFLMKLRNSKLEDDDLVSQFYDKVIEGFIYPENYYIVLIHSVYDVPGKSSDGAEMFDASDVVYDHILCSICPVKMSKAGLSYNSEKNQIEDRMRDWVVEVPMKGFLFPAFNDRTADIHQVLYYSKDPEEIQPEFIDHLLGSHLPMTAEVQKESFQMMIADTLGDACDYEVMRNIHENLQEMIEEHKEEPEPLQLSKPDIKRLLENSGAPEDKLDVFEQEYEAIVGEKNTLMAANIADTRKFNIETPNVVVKVKPDRTDLVETRVIDGRQCIVIAVDDYIEVNGVNVKMLLAQDGGQQQEGAYEEAAAEVEE